ncbi:NAD-dependent epimerase/dehydratase family protein [Motiliproteus sediminis]|uniref:NAD-dependent epimerase/dehydratase family protein n=1 Tax=Motiliproteus sediminis TaxID=1468178 RepID=UPI001AEFA68C|nr:NAD-dependent epimerase/dehydratase family protein [Motiliproteus sediminis]
MELMVTGASGGIGRALVEQARRQGIPVLAVTRSEAPVPGATDSLTACPASDYPWRLTDLLHPLPRKPRLVIHCGGMLHQAEQRPEKRLADLEPGFLHHNLERNCIDSVHLLQTLTACYGRRDPLTVALLSARVGSISDNRLGGWYSYRMSKAALNMLVKTTAIEWQRSHPAACIVAQHPGTTDTPLSRPFQRHIEAAKLYTPETTANRLLDLITSLSPAQSGQFLNWDGTRLPW